MTTFGYDPEAIVQDADIEMAELEAYSSDFHRRVKQSQAASSDAERVRLCPHGGGYPLDSLAAKNNQDPRTGQEGVRCYDCNGVLTCFPFKGEPQVLHTS